MSKVILIIVFLLSSIPALAGSVVTLVMTNGDRVEVEILGFSQGRFTVRQRAVRAPTEISLDEVKEIDFGEVAIEEPPENFARRLDLDHALLLVQEQRFYAVYRAMTQLRNSGGKRITNLLKEIEEKISQPETAPDLKRDLSILRITALYTIGEDEQAREAARQLNLTYGNDPKVQRFMLNILQLGDLVERRLRPGQMNPQGGRRAEDRGRNVP